MNSSVELNSNARKSNSFLRGVVVCVMATKKGVDSIWLRNAPTARATSASAQTAPRVWVRRLTHIFSRTVFNIFAAKSTENKSFRCFFEPLAGFEPPTSSLPSDKMPSSRCGIRVCGRFCPKKEEVGNSLLHVFRPLVSPCGSRCGSEPPASSVWVNFLWQWNGHILRCWKQ